MQGSTASCSLLVTRAADYRVGPLIIAFTCCCTNWHGAAGQHAVSVGAFHNAVNV
jgi:hypothetical protein